MIKSKIILVLCGIISTMAAMAEVIELNESSVALSEMEENNRIIIGQLEELQHKISVLEKKIEEFEAANQQTPSEQFTSSKELIEEVKKLIQSKKYKNVISLLTDFLGKTPKDSYRGQAFFYLGEAYYAGNETKKAAVAYMNSNKEAPSGAKAIESLYKAHLALLKTQNKDGAKIVLNKLINTYAIESPKNEFVQKAKTALKNLK